ncbi:DNA polymerase I [bacterium]|nr:DNA polymerase I [bacterium]
MLQLEKDKDVLLAIDSNAIVHRAFHAYPSSLQTEDGLQVNAVYGFTTMFLEALNIFNPKYILCAFDTHKPTFRKLEFPEYKATRKPTDQSLIDQFPMVEEVVKAFNVPILKKDGYEADDILGSIARLVKEGKWQNENIALYILSGDRDLLQLVGGNVKVCLPKGNFSNIVIYDKEETHKYMGIYPEQVVDYKAIAGDTSDNIPGIKGIGTKTTIDLLDKYKTLDNIYKNLDKLKPRQSNLFQEGVEQAQVSKMLARIEDSVEINTHLEDCVLKDFNKNTVVSLFKKYSFRSLIPKLDKIQTTEEENKGNSVTSQLGIFSQPLEQLPEVDYPTLQKSLSNSKKTVLVYINKSESTTGEDYFLIRTDDKDCIYKLDKEKILELQNDVITYNLEECIRYVNIGKTYNVHDVGIFAHLLNSEKRKYDLNSISFDYSSYSLEEKISPTQGKQVLDILVEMKEKQLEIANKTIFYDYSQKTLKECLNIEKDYYVNVQKSVEIPLSQILSKMESRGIQIDVDKLEKLKTDLEDKIEQETEEIYSTVGHEFNIKSPKQLADVLYNELGLPGKKTTKESVLEKLKDYHPCIPIILDYRILNKMLSTYVIPLLELAKNSKDSSIHTDFKQTGTSSGRLSSVNPNMQNIPMQGEWAEKIRKTFIPRKGYKFLGMDYSQMELRIMADMSGDELLQKDFRDNIDIHASTASRILNKKIEGINKQERSIGKTVNFAIIFGQTGYGLASLLNIDSDTATAYIRSYFEHYKGVENYIRELEKEAKQKGYVQSMLGTTRHVKGLNSKNVRVYKAAQREAVNMPIQGSESDIMKLAMIKLDKMIEENYKEDAYILLQIHDELLFEVKEEIVDEFEKKAKEIMLHASSLTVPLELSSNSGYNMAEIKD